MLSQCLWPHVYISPAVCGTCCFLGITHHLRLLKSVYFFSQKSLNLEERSLTKVSHLGPRAPVSHCLHSVRLWNFILIIIFPYSFFRVDLLLLRKRCHHWYCKHQQGFHYIQRLFVFKGNNKRESWTQWWVKGKNGHAVIINKETKERWQVWEKPALDEPVVPDIY